MNQKPEKRVHVRTDVEPLPLEVAAWMPKAVAEASEQLEEALERREENEIAHEIAQSAARSAARANEAAEDEAILAGKPISAAKHDRAAAEALDEARRAMHASDRVAAAAVDAYIRTLDEHDEQIGALLGERVAAENLRARRALQEVESAIVNATQLDRLGGTLRNPRWTGSQPMSRRAWETPTTAASHAGLAAVDELFNIVGRDLALAS